MHKINYNPTSFLKNTHSRIPDWGKLDLESFMRYNSLHEYFWFNYHPKDIDPWFIIIKELQWLNILVEVKDHGCRAFLKKGDYGNCKITVDNKYDFKYFYFLSKWKEIAASLGIAATYIKFSEDYKIREEYTITMYLGDFNYNNYEKCESLQMNLIWCNKRDILKTKGN